MNKRSICINAVATSVLVALGCSVGSGVAAEDVGSRSTQSVSAKSVSTKSVGTKAVGAEPVSTKLVTERAPLKTPFSSRFTLVPEDKKLKRIYDDLVLFRSDLALKELAPIVISRSKRGLKTPQDRLLMGRLMVLVGYCYLIDDNYLSGLNSFTIAHKLCPEDTFTKCVLATVLRDYPDFDAEDRLVNELKKVPEKDRFPLLYATLARNARRDGDIQLATEYIKKAEALDIDKSQPALQMFYARMLVLSGLDEPAVERFKLAADRTENKYIREILLANQASIQFKDVAQEEHLRNASKIYPDDPIWRLKLAEYYLQRGNETEALPLLEQTIQCKRFSAGAYFRLARCYMQKGQYDKALDVVQHLERRTRPTSDMLIFKGELEAARNNKPQAEKYFDQALKINSKNWGLYETLAKFYMCEKDRAQDGVKISEAFVKAMPKFWPAHFTSAQCLLHAKQLDAAGNEATKALQLLSVYPQSDLNLYALHRAGIAHAIIGTKHFVVDSDYKRAATEAKAFNLMKFNPELPDYLRMVVLRPERLKFNDALGLRDPMVHVAMADMLLECNYVDQCIEEYKKAQTLAPDDQAVRSYLIHAMSQKGDWRGAASENFAFSQSIVNQIPAAIDELRNGKKKKTDDPAKNIDDSLKKVDDVAKPSATTR
ncbi:MAG: tetratricopeptide repeat protein [Candidatus Melainabacteria bacterium]|nr:tetratricopeptide repeat protein [Candidatus Melainabacteria bacterium]